MKTLRIVNDKGCVYLERRVLRRWWYRLSPVFRSNIEAYNWVRTLKNVNLIKKR